MRADKRTGNRYSWDDRRLIEAAQLGDHEAADVLFARYDQYLLRVARSVTASQDEAAEAAAAGRARAWEKLPTLRDPDRFGAWVAAIVKHSAADAQRLRAREVPRAEAPEIIYLDDYQGDSTADVDRLSRARAAVLSLSARDRKALELSVFEQLPVGEVAAALQIDPNAAYQVLHRARKRIRRAYLTPSVPDSAPDDCRVCAKQTPDYVRGSLAARAAVDTHVESCLSCRSRLAEVLADSSHMKGVFGILLPVAAGLRAVWQRRPGSTRRTATQAAVLTAVVVAVAGGMTAALASSGHRATGSLAVGSTAAPRRSAIQAAGAPPSTPPPTTTAKVVRTPSPSIGAPRRGPHLIATAARSARAPSPADTTAAATTTTSTTTSAAPEVPETTSTTTTTTTTTIAPTTTTSTTTTSTTTSTTTTTTVPHRRHRGRGWGAGGTPPGPA